MAYLLLDYANLIGALIVLYFLARFYLMMSDSKAKSALKLLVGGFVFMAINLFIDILHDYGMFTIAGAHGPLDTDDYMLAIAYVFFIAAMFQLRKLLFEVEVQKKAIKLLNQVFTE